jgi:hypothetical protein
MSRRQVFPQAIDFRGFANARLLEVISSGRERIGRYALDPIDEPEYASHAEAIRGVDGLRFVAVPGVWSSYRLIDLPGGDDRLELFVGIEEQSLRDHLGAMSSLGMKRDTVVPEFLVRALALGYLDRVGA